MEYNHLIKIYPVGNADNVLIKIGSKAVIIDCQIRKSDAKDEKDKSYFDTKEDMLALLPKNSDGRPYVDLYVSTHMHEDHVIGFGDNYYIGDPAKYKEDDKKKIMIGELWVSPRTFDSDVCDEAIPIRKEAKRRRKLYTDNEANAGGNYNKLRIIGYDQDKEFDKRYSYIPGTLVTNINGNSLSDAEIFIHAPFKEDVERAKVDSDKNASCIVLQFTFIVNGSVKCKAVFGGDADHYVYNKILENTPDEREDRVKWNIFLASHHCSWSFFNDSTNEDKTDVKQSALDFLDKGESFRYIVSSSKEITDNGNNPPCYEAMEQYKNKLVYDSHFRCTGADDNRKDDISQPIVFTIDNDGFKLNKQSVVQSSGILENPAPRAGR
jgi:ribonuclease BN (tRNA processing enzyme)